MSKIEISVDWETPVVFAGEEIRCIITFKNTSAPTAAAKSPEHPDQLRNPTSAREKWKLDLPVQQSLTATNVSRATEGASQEGKRLGHRPTLSLNAPVSTTRTGPPGSGGPGSGRNGDRNRQHKKSVSIISIGQQSPVEDRENSARVTPIQQLRKSHARSASFQGLPVRRTSLPNSPQLPQSAGIPPNPQSTRSTSIPLSNTTSPLSNVTFNSQVDETAAEVHSRSKSAQYTQPSQSQDAVMPPRRASRNEEFEPRTADAGSNPDSKISTIKESQPQRSYRNPSGSPHGDVTHRSLQRVISPTSEEGTPRSSMEIYSHSNHSSETLQSEYITTTNVGGASMHRRHGSYLGPIKPQNETLMMGYVQLVGSFILEGSLINLAPFESVKRKAVIGGQGSGGVVGVESSKRDSGLFGSLGWSSFGQSLGGLLGSEEPSSLREMKGIANSKSVPIISTAQSILFVDLQLRPGESKSFTYGHLLPPGLPPSFKGRAIKSSYHLVVGTQRPRSSRPQVSRPQHQVRQIEVPFRVLPCVDQEGEVLGHDLMSPHVILKDMSSTKALDSSTKSRSTSSPPLPDAKSGGADFAQYIGELLEGTRNNSSAGLLSPTASLPSTAAGQSKPSSRTILSAKDLIDLAITQQSASGVTRASSTSLQISRAGEKVAKVVLARTSFRVGETVSGSVDFEDADVMCFTFNASLESAEIVDPAIALRSSASIHRATRRIHAQVSENTLCASRVSFALTIPSTAVPEFITSGVRLEWKLRLEFVTAEAPLAGPCRGLLEVNEEGERGVFMSATQELPSQTFEVPVSLRVYGITNTDTQMNSASGYRV